jgi:hypothetical protein
LNLGFIRDYYGDDTANTIRDILSRYEEKELVWYDKKRDLVGLVAPDGFLLSNDIISSIFAEL